MMGSILKYYLTLQYRVDEHKNGEKGAGQNGTKSVYRGLKIRTYSPPNSNKGHHQNKSQYNENPFQHCFVSYVLLK